MAHFHRSARLAYPVTTIQGYRVIPDGTATEAAVRQCNEGLCITLEQAIAVAATTGPQANRGSPNTADPRGFWHSG
jgi:hypothetical protein